MGAYCALKRRRRGDFPQRKPCAVMPTTRLKIQQK